jgi:hypothetical protein
MAIVDEALNISTAECASERGGRQSDPAAAGNADRLMEEGVKIISRAGDLFAVALHHAAPQDPAEKAQDRLPLGL